jgi:Na+/H+ antiporter NhaC
MASAGSQCDHVNHVSTQLPYALLVAAISCVTYIVAGFVQSVWLPMICGLALVFVTIFVLKLINRPRKLNRA